MFEREISIQILIEIEIINHRLNVFLLRNIRITYNIYIYSQNNEYEANNNAKIEIGIS